MKKAAGSPTRVAVMVGSGHVPGLNAVVLGAAVAAGELGWETVGIRDGFDGLLYPERYPEGGLVTLDPGAVASLDPNGAGVLGQAPRVDPFNVRRVNKDEMVEEADLSDALLEKLKAERIDALIGVVGGKGLSILYKLHKKGLNVVCVPRSIENDIAATMVSFGFNSALSFTIEMLDRARQAAQSARKIGVVEVLGEQSGWLALQAGIAVNADVVLIPEIPADLATVAASLKEQGDRPAPVGPRRGGRRGDAPRGRRKTKTKPLSLKASLSPLATGEASEHVIRRSGQAAEALASRLQLLLAEEIFPLVLGPWARGGAPTAVDRQLGMAYGAGAVRAVSGGCFGTMVAFVPPDLKFIPLPDAINKVRTVPVDGGFVQIARSLGICLGKEL